MKKVILTLAAVAFMATSAMAQKVNADAIRDKIEKGVAATQDAKKSTKSATWISLGKAYYEAGTANTAALFPGMTYDMLVLSIGKASNEAEPEVRTIGGKDYAGLKYDAIIVYLDPSNNTVHTWEETNPIISENPFEKSIEAYKKAYEIDPKSASKVIDGYNSVITALTNDGQGFYEFGEFTKAANNFAAAATYALEIPNGPAENAQQLLFFAGVASVQAELYEQAEKMVTKLLESGYEQNGDCYIYLATAQDKLGKKAEAKETYLAGIKKYVNNTALLSQFISFAIMNGEDPAIILPYVLTAQEADPQNTGLMLAEGIVYDKMKDYDKAVAAYDKALKINPEFFGALYNKGFAYYTKAGEINKEIGKTDYTNKARIEELRKEFVETMKAAIEPFEKAHELNPKDPSVVELLRSSYFSLREEGDDMLEKYKHFDSLSKSMK